MFENQTPPNLPVDKEVEDIFASTESVQSTPSASGEVRGAPRETPRTGFKRLIFLILGVVVVALAAWGSWNFFTSFRLSARKSAPAVQPAPKSVPAVTESRAPTADEAPAAVESRPQEPVDADGDGLSDDEEIARGTSPSSADTDNDGLTDREEIRVYKSDPLNSDTDGDSYLDGHEVRNNYSPTGPGKLLPQVPQPSS